jgi:GGDEF domain-containing protein
MVECRVDHAKRKRVAEMSPEGMRTALLVSEKTGLANERAYDEAEPSEWVAMGDVDGLKRLNDQYGYAAGDTLIERLAAVFLEVELDAYHDKGDEFIFGGSSFKELDIKLAKAERILKDQAFVVHTMNDTVKPINGAWVSYGIGTNLKEAEKSLKHQKEIRKAER